MPRIKSITSEEVRRRRREVSDRARAAELVLPHGMREMREALGLSRREFADLVVIRLTARQIADIETGRVNPTARTLETIGRIFGFRLGFVPCGSGTQPGAPFAWKPKPPTPEQSARLRARHAAARKRRLK
ncbi:XRE family transcriptional regulator [Bradyrhizobium frederickii]|uniref:XRE family transcriptional regulator n=1 Tax=Bradyrhizobium frederickii TaxID=2560054 RepID=A0A4Y9KX35_9BRAD|nr:helix-turn-helix transcriptional regulator [Bradyrhizobium frederickii]TFV30960.1 XRE family transcriptional regulator [Bradyrhizobium frederickii]